MIITGKRWEVLEGQTSPSGCQMFRCLGCGVETKVPTRACLAGCHDDGEEVELFGWRYREVRSYARADFRPMVRLLVWPWGVDGPKRQKAGLVWWLQLQLRAARC